MAKRRELAQTETRTKRLKLKVQSEAAVTAKKKKDEGNDTTEEEEELQRKIKPKPRSSSRPAGGATAAGATSKYFGSECDSKHDVDTKTTATKLLRTETVKDEEDSEDSEEEEDDWEEVEELEGPLGPVEPSEPVLPSEPLQIEIETPEVRKREKRKAEFESYLRRMMNRYKKDLLIDTHKVHLLCLIANGMFRSRLCCEPDLLAVTLSLLPTHYGMVAKQRIDQNFLSGLLKWFRATFTLNPSLPSEERQEPRALLERRLGSLSAKNHQEMTHLFLLVLRSLQLFCRLVLSLQPIPLKLPSAKGKGAGTSGRPPGKSPTGQGVTKPSPTQTKVSPGAKRTAERTKGGRGGKKARKTQIKEEEEEKSVTSGGQKPKNSKRRSIASKVSYKEESNSDGGQEEEEGVSDEEFQATSEGDSEDSGKEFEPAKGKKEKSKGRVNGNISAKTTSGGTKQVKKEEEEDRDGGGEEEGEGAASSATKRRSGKRRGGRGFDEWLEVYVEKTSTWVCVDVEHGVGKPHLCSQNATAPVTYVVSVDDDGFLKDLGRKYDPTWMTSSRKRRVEEEWWEQTTEPFMGPEDERDKKEEKELQVRLMNTPLPTSVSEYKNHPLYALQRHLLKYEAVYPPTAAVLGYCRGEPVYSRDCVRTLHSSDTWLKEARTVLLGEEPYKMVKGFSNRSRKARIMTEQKDAKDLALFGEWQTEDYQPPLAVDGKIPRNDYGNVYLFKPCMLPVGCVHLRLSNLNRVARKLNMDAAPAVTGFDFHGGYSHAVTDGYIVCEEHEEILRAAWVEDQEIQKQKEREKREKRVISNWTLLVKGLLIRERLKQRYGKKQQGPAALPQSQDGQGAEGLSSDEEEAQGRSPEATTAAETLAMSWPQNRQTEEDAGGASGLRKTTTKREKRGQEKHLFPFEKA
ncbi:DNA repair protein complementing XP-C cells [Genypterus blacodes]|uniref:DNA repair protein complementing XP-C cells n=1 Tax=Genypterus blacodes TaxID=154954 RepID=UPI003F75D12E